MEHRSLKFNFDEGQITGISINAQLDATYKKMFQNARRCARRNPLDVDHGIKVIIFGCFWLEARSNEQLRFILKQESKDSEFGNALWEKLRRSNILDKLQIISVFATQPQQKKYSLLSPKLKNAFDLRNRLAHFKDEDTQLTGAVNLNEAIKLLETLPVPGLNQELMWPKINEYAETISETNIWLNSFNKVYCRRKKIKITNLDTPF